MMMQTLAWFCGWLALAPWTQAAPDPVAQFAVERREVAPGVATFVEGQHAVVSSNITVVEGRDAAMVFDAGHHPAVTRRIVEDIKRRTSKPVRYLVISHWHMDHWVGAAEIADAFPGIQVIAHPFTAKLIAAEAPFLNGALCREDFEAALPNLRNLVATGKTADGTSITPERRARLTVFLGDSEAALAECGSKRTRNADRLVDASTMLDLGGRSVRVEWLGPANTAGDLVAFVPDVNLVLTGDLVVHPFPFATQTFVPEWARALRRIEQSAPAIIVPGHGEPMRDLAYVRVLASMFESIERQAKAAWTAGMTVEALRAKIDVTPFRKQIAGDNPFYGANFDAQLTQLAIERMWQALAGQMKPEGFASIRDKAPDAAEPNEIERAVAAAVKAWNVPGAAVAVVKDGRVVLSRGYGVRKLGDPAAVDDATTFYTASVTKTFTVAALGALADAGKLRIDDPVTKYLPEFGVGDAELTRQLTVRDLMAHRTGVARADLLMFAGLGDDEVLGRMKAVKPSAPLRSRFTYQNQMYLALGAIAARVGGGTWQQVVESRLLTPLGMADSNAAGLGHAAGPNTARPHALLEGAVTPVDLVARAPYGAGGVNASARDLAKWLQFQLGDGTWQGTKLVNPQVIQAPQQPNTITAPTVWTPDATFLLYGLGWFLSDYHGHKVVQHGGNGEGWTSLVWMIPDLKLGVAVVTNMHNTLLPWAIAHAVADASGAGGTSDWNAKLIEAEKNRNAAQARQAPKTGAGPIDAAAWEGEWQSPVYGSLTISRAGDRLQLRYGPALVGDLAPGATATQAVVTWQRSDMRAVLGPTGLTRAVRGDVVGLAISLGGDTAEFVKAGPTGSGSGN